MSERYKSDYEKTGNIAIDMVAAAVYFYRRKHGIEPARIKLKPNYYDLFRKGIEIIVGKQLDWTGGVKFEGIPIDRGAMSMIDNMDLIFHGKIPVPGGIIGQA